MRRLAVLGPWELRTVGNPPAPPEEKKEDETTALAQPAAPELHYRPQTAINKVEAGKQAIKLSTQPPPTLAMHRQGRFFRLALL